MAETQPAACDRREGDVRAAAGGPAGAIGELGAKVLPSPVAAPDELPRLLKLHAASTTEKLAQACSPSASTRASERDAAEATPHEAQELSLLCGAHQIPHPAKASYGGEDAFFTSEAGGAVGVADGVSEWGWRFGMNPRDFSEQLMAGARAATEAAAAELPAASAQERAAKALHIGHAGTKAFGAATAIVAVLDPARSRLGVANLGDSGLRQFRRAPEAPEAQLLARTEEQQHELNKPFQLSRVPGREDFRGLLAEGKRALVEAVQKCGHMRLDQPSDACLYDLPVQEGDLLVLASDGVFDNLYDAEVSELVSKAFLDAEAEEPRSRGLAEPAALAAAIAEAAFAKSQDRKADTPFGQRVRQAGFTSPGGLPDDITVVVAWVAGKQLPGRA